MFELVFKQPDVLAGELQRSRLVPKPQFNLARHFAVVAGAVRDDLALDGLDSPHRTGRRVIGQLHVSVVVDGVVGQVREGEQGEFSEDARLGNPALFRAFGLPEDYLGLNVDS